MKFNSAGWKSAVLSSVLLVSTAVSGFDLDPKDPESIKTVAWEVQHEMMKWYGGNSTNPDTGIAGWPGNFGEPYHWWESGAAFGAMVDYWYYTGDAGNNEAVQEAIVHQAGDQWNFEPANQTTGLGNDDECYWALTAMSAAEKKFPDPPADKPQYLLLAQTVFNQQLKRLELEEKSGPCGGGLRWQVHTFKDGYDYKNTVSNGCFFHLGARLARYTGNVSYVDPVTRAYDWLVKTKLITEDFRALDGAQSKDECAEETHDRNEWTYNVGILMAGSAYLYDFALQNDDTEAAELWKSRVMGFLESSQQFFARPGAEGIMNERLCEFVPIEREKTGACNQDQRSFKAYLARYMALTVKLVPETVDIIMPLLEKSAVAAARQCSNGAEGKTCGMRWTEEIYDGRYGIGEQMTALEVIQSLLIHEVDGPADEVTGTSMGAPNGEFGNFEAKKEEHTLEPATAGDKAGAAILTIIMLSLLIGTTYWLFADANE